MRLPSPDDALISAFDRMLAIPQRQGIPLPILRVPLHFVMVPGSALVQMGLAGYSSTLPDWTIGNRLAETLVIAFAILLGCEQAMRYARAKLRDAMRWSTTLAMSYRAEALLERKRFAGVRTAIMAAVLLLGCGALWTWQDAALWYATLFLGGWIAFGVGLLILSYVESAMPRDPDLTQRVGLGTT